MKIGGTSLENNQMKAFGKNKPKLNEENDPEYETDFNVAYKKVTVLN